MKWKLHGLPESMVSDRGLQFVAELTKKLNRMLEIKTKLLTSFYSQTDGQIERMNQELEQYLRFFIDYKQKNWPEWLALTEFVVNNKVHLATRIFLFITNYSKKLKIGVNIRKKEKVEKVMKFVVRMKRVQEEVGVVLRNAQKEMK